MPRQIRRITRTHADGRPVKITFGEMREMGIQGVLIYCCCCCGHHIAVSADRWPDEVRLSDVEPRCICTACGRRGAEVRPDFNWAGLPTSARFHGAGLIWAMVGVVLFGTIGFVIFGNRPFSFGYAVAFCGLVIAVGSDMASQLPPRFVLLSSGIALQQLINVPLSTALLSHGLAPLFLLWHMTPKAALIRTEY